MRSRFVFSLVCLVTVILTASAFGRRIRTPTVAERVASSSWVVRGKMVRLEPKLVKAQQYPSSKKVEFQVAVVKIEEGIQAPKGLTHLRVGHIPSQGFGGYGTKDLTEGQEVLLFLEKHPIESFYMPGGMFHVTSSKHAQYARELKEARESLALLKEAKKHLKGNDEKNRTRTAALLVHRYRGYSPWRTKQVDLDQAESTLILRALAEANWKAPVTNYMLSPRYAFDLLGIGPQDGFMRPAKLQEVEIAAKKWLKANSMKYRIKRRVTATPK